MSNDQELSIKGTVSLEDFSKYNAYHFKKYISTYFIVTFIIYWAILILLELLLANTLLFLIPKGIIALIMSLITILAIKKTLKKRAIKEYKSDQRIKSEISYKFSSSGISQEVDRSSNFFDWSDIYLAKEHKEMFLLYMSKHKAVILPKRFFESNSDIDLFKLIVFKNLPSSKTKF